MTIQLSNKLNTSIDILAKEYSKRSSAPPSPLHMKITKPEKYLPTGKYQPIITGIEIFPSPTRRN